MNETKPGISVNTTLVAGGFATVQPNSAMSINATEGYPLEDFSADAIRAQISEAQKVASGSGSEQDIAEAKIELEVRSPSKAIRFSRYLLLTLHRFLRLLLPMSNRGVDNRSDVV
jgi:hypothetical protein